ncbi:hypothetical protein BKA65DRAFT_54129 [Rhexocercosporidium sp. MPI-PUGE-AT-0058]|nr:hypothetical protein BKA65DRAFT_54129 [Rhexocercosporidium sp. MPI-PUGE-AT-0058]
MASPSSQAAVRAQQVSAPKVVTTGTGQPPSEPVEPTIKIHYLEDKVQQDANHRVQWSDWMSDGQKRSFYKHVFVLLLSWHPDCDDMAVRDEVERLQKVFEDTYNYEVKSFQIDSRKPESPQSQVNFEVAHFVHEHDHKDDSLFIIYYAGHGSPGKIPGDLKISGRRKDKMRSKQFVDITWNLVEGNLQETRADVLQIFDCCHASDLGRGSNLNSRSFEHLAASTTPYTRSPGDHSFTSALIWALKDLGSPFQESPMFATSKLAKRIYDAPNFPREQKPSLTTRNVDALHHIILAPIPHDRSIDTPVPDNVEEDEEAESDDESDKAVPQFLSLTFQFKEAQDDENLKKLADHLKMFMRLDTGLQKVQWGALWDGSGPPPGARMREIVKKFMASEQSPIWTARSKWAMVSSAVRRKRLVGRERRDVAVSEPADDEGAPLLSGASSDTYAQEDSNRGFWNLVLSHLRKFWRSLMMATG